mmetsp:Transcript_1282/g.3655  ORF Transcript_1282/g.3655 Transcript_1282/m.3655 type:complete len:498 (+) Transcript_1282:392-1885(+)
MVGVGEQGTDKLLVVHRAAVVLVERVEELEDAFIREADLHALQEVPELRDVQLPVVVAVGEPEEHRDVVCGVAPLPEAVARPLHEQDTVALVPRDGEGVADDSQRHRHVEHGDDHEDPRDDGAGSARGGDIAVAHRGHGHHRQPYRGGERGDVIPRLHKVDEHREEELDDEEHEEEDGQRLCSQAEGLQQQVELLESPQELHDPQDRHCAQEEPHLPAHHVGLDEHRAQSGAQGQGGRRGEVYQVVDVQPERPLVRAGHQPDEELQQEDALNGNFQDCRGDSMEWRWTDGLQKRHANREDDVRRHQPGAPAGHDVRVGVLQPAPDRGEDLEAPALEAVQDLGLLDLLLGQLAAAAELPRGPGAAGQRPPAAAPRVDRAHGVEGAAVGGGRLRRAGHDLQQVLLLEGLVAEPIQLGAVRCVAQHSPKRTGRRIDAGGGHARYVAHGPPEGRRGLLRVPHAPGEARPLDALDAAVAHPPLRAGWAGWGGSVAHAREELV